MTTTSANIKKNSSYTTGPSVSILPERLRSITTPLGYSLVEGSFNSSSILTDISIEIQENQAESSEQIVDRHLEKYKELWKALP